MFLSSQGYYYHDMGSQQQPQPYAAAADASYPPPAYQQQQLAYAGGAPAAAQPYWYAAAPYGEGGSAPGAAQAGNPQEGGNLGAPRDRDVKTQRRKEANRESARRSKQRKKEESELLSSKAQELVRESTCLRSELEKVQKQADKLYSENMALRNQVANAGGSLPPSPERFVPVQLPPPIELPASLVMDASNATSSENDRPAPTASPAGSEGNGYGAGDDGRNDRAVSAMPAMMRAGDDVLGEGHVDLPSLLENELTNRNGEAVNVDQFAQLPLTPTDGAIPGDMLMSEAIVSFREPADGDSLFAPSGALDDDIVLAGALRNPAQHFGSGKRLGAASAVEDFSPIRQSGGG